MAKKLRALTKREKVFIQEYIKHFNGYKAGLACGMPKKSARSQASRLLTRVNIRAALTDAIHKRSERTKIDADWVLKNAAILANKCLGNEEVKTGIKGKETISTEFNPTAAKGALELIGKHIDVKAFDNTIPLIGDPNRPLEFNLNDTERAARVAEMLKQALKK